jgi:3-(methylthio)propanoyl-CoA dehydrogenase
VSPRHHVERPSDAELTTGVTSPYRAPIEDITLALDVAGLEDLLSLEDFCHLDRDSVLLALEEFGRLATELIAPSDLAGDLIGALFDAPSSSVTTPAAFHDAYRPYVRNGWGTLAFPREFGGGGLPSLVALAQQEIFASANMALSLNPVLTQGAIETLLRWGTPRQRTTYLPRLLTGEWTGTMNLTEPDAGSDLGEISTIAEPYGPSIWRLKGTKIFITWGEHDLAENIVHLVLARTPDAPAGTKGLSLFVVPKYILTSEGLPGERNAVKCVGIEEKLGIHGSPTCVMSFDHALGELVGPLHGGMRAMFTMMNSARLSIGIQGPAIGERAFQHALRFASERLQGRANGVVTPQRSSIVEHLDVRRMLLTMSTTTQASRLLLYWVGAQEDLARHGTNRELAQSMVDLVTPIAKAWSTDTGFQTASLGIQVLGGAGYIEESGMAQRLRDARIGPIYEGTNGIQAIDLVFRKIGRDEGKWVRYLVDEMAASIPDVSDVDDPLAISIRSLGSALSMLRSTTEWMVERVARSDDDALAGATAYLELFGMTMGGWLMIKRARLAAARYKDKGKGKGKEPHAVGESNFFAVEVMGRSAGLARPIMAGADHLRISISHLGS